MKNQHDIKQKTPNQLLMKWCFVSVNKDCRIGGVSLVDNLTKF